VAKINIEGQNFIKAKCDEIRKVGAVWKIDHHLNKVSLLAAQGLQEIIEFSQLSKIDFNSSF
jgi:hypothetical protein